MKNYLLIIFSFFLFQQIAAGQTHTVKGTVSDEQTGELIPGANVLIKGTSKGVATDFNGIYSIAANPNDILVISYLGYKTIEVPINGKNIIDISLAIDASQLDEIVVVAFGTQKKQSVVGAQATVKPAELKTPVRDLTTAIAGRLAGVVATQRGWWPWS